MLDFATKEDNVGDLLTAEEFNNYINELENVILLSGGALSSDPAVVNQLYTQIVAMIESYDSDYTKVRVSDDDTTPEYLDVKVVGSNSINTTVNNGGANETLSISTAFSTAQDVIDGTVTDTSVAPATLQEKAATDTEVSAASIDTKFVTPANMDAVLSYVRSNIHEVGHIMFTATSTNPSSTYGGTWTQVSQGRYITGVGSDTVDGVTRAYAQGEDSAGRYEVSLTEAQNGAHGHRVLGVDSVDSDLDPLENNSIAGDSSTQYKYVTTGKDSNPIVEDSGSGDAHENTPPAYGLYCWQKTA